jgi:hypothetical protein
MIGMLLPRLMLASVFFLSYNVMYSQVGIGTAMPDSSAMLDVFATNKGVLIPRVALTKSTDITTISNGNREGLLVYNTATISDVNQGFYYWSNEKWNKIATTTDGQKNTSVDNGLTILSDRIGLGGTLTQPTVITTNGPNTLAVEGLQTASEPVAILVVNKATGVMQRIEANTLMKEKQSFVLANDGQTEFMAPLPIEDPAKINVYRNGIRIDFTALNVDTIKLEDGVVCYQDDEIRIVQYY